MKVKSEFGTQMVLHYFRKIKSGCKDPIVISACGTVVSDDSSKPIATFMRYTAGTKIILHSKTNSDVLFDVT
eukprot:4276721-Amphidinium_carterae.1